MHRALLRCAIAASLALSIAPVRASPPGIAVIDCTLIDDNAAYNDAEKNRVQQARVLMTSEALRGDLRERGLFSVADNAPGPALMPQRQSTPGITACNGCERQIGPSLGVARVGVCWVQKISN